LFGEPSGKCDVVDGVDYFGLRVDVGLACSGVIVGCVAVGVVRVGFWIVEVVMEDIGLWWLIWC